MKISLATISTIYYESEGVKLILIVLALGLLITLTIKLQPYTKKYMTKFMITSSVILIISLLTQLTIIQV